VIYGLFAQNIIDQLPIMNLFFKLYLNTLE